MIKNKGSTSASRKMRWQETFAALKHPNYRLWFSGQLVSLMGTWMQSTAQGYLVYQLTGSPTYLGLVGFFGGLPTWIFTLFGGVAADRLPRRTVLLLTQSFMLILAFILAGLTFTELVQPWHIVLLAFLLGVANAFDAPARVSFVAELVEREDMSNAIAMNSTMFNTATVVGPSIAGLTYASLGPGWCFTINGLSFIAVISALLLMRLTPQSKPATRGSALGDVKEGLRYVFAHRTILSLIMGVGITGIFGMGMLTLIPAWARDVLNGDVTTNGLLISARGVGALVSALMMASMGRRQIRGKFWTAGSFVMPVLLFAFAWTRWLPLSLVILLGVGWSFMMLINNTNAMIQSLVTDHLRGRVMSIYSLIFFGSMTLGALIAGTTAEQIGEPLTVMLSSSILLLLAILAFIFLPNIRRQG